MQNAVKHGLFAVQDVVTTENQAQFDSMPEQMLKELAPVGAVETLLAQWALNLAWWLKRAQTMQTQAIEDMIESHVRDMLDRFAKWPDTYGIDTKDLSAFVKKTYGHMYPEMMEAMLKRWNSSPAQPKAICDPQTPGSSKNKGLPLSF